MTGRYGIAVVALVLAVGLTGCDDSADLNSDPGTLGVATEIQQAGGSDFEQAGMVVQQIEIRPLDPVADEAIGPRPIALLRTSLSIDLNSGEPIALPAVPVQEGEYRVTRLTITAPRLVNENPAPPDAAVACLDKISDFPGFVNVPGTIVLSYPDPDTAPTVWVPGNGGVSVLRLTVESRGLVERYVAGFLCRETSNCVNARPGPGEPAPPPPCIDLFNLDGTFESDLADYIGFTGESAASR